MLRMDIRTLPVQKFFFTFHTTVDYFFSAVTVENTYSKENSPIQKSQIIEGSLSFRIWIARKLDAIIHKTLNTVNLTLGKIFSYLKKF